jgi:crossover junction endodeoxyribonuclease RuvC
LWTKKLENDPELAFGCGLQKNVRIVRKFDGTVIGIDASLRGTGVAVVNFSGTGQKLLLSKKIACHRKLSFAECIGSIFGEISSTLANFSVDVAAIEQTIYVQNYRISHILGAAKGAAIAAVVVRNLKIFEYAPLSIKQAITGTGGASKEQVRRTVCKIFGIPEISYDESDAIGAACCHAWRWKSGI